MARGIKRDLQRAGLRTVYDDTGAIGKLYRRQDEVGTPFCITVDFQSLDDQTVTVRDRDTMGQERVGSRSSGRRCGPRSDRLLTASGGASRPVVVQAPVAGRSVDEGPASVLGRKRSNSCEENLPWRAATG